MALERYAGPIVPGMRFFWRPDTTWAHCEIEVTRKTDHPSDGLLIHARVVCVFDGCISRVGEESANEADHFRCSVAPVAVEATPMVRLRVQLNAEDRGVVARYLTDANAHEPPDQILWCGRRFVVGATEKRPGGFTHYNEFQGPSFYSIGADDVELP